MTAHSKATNDIAWADPARSQAFFSWLSTLAASDGVPRLDNGSLRLASADASFRRYFRINAATGSDTFIIMDAPPDKEDCKPFASVAELLAQAGLQAPRVLAWDEPAGFMLLNDLGSRTMMEVMAPPLAVDVVVQPSPADHDLYMAAADVLVRWQLASKPGVLPLYDDALLSREINLFPEWYIGKHRGIALKPEQQATLDAAFTLIKASNLDSLDGARVYVHRDFMARNLMVTGQIEEPLGVLDFQDAVYGPVTYDIASLMRDAFLTVEEDFVLDITIRYWQKARKAGLPVGDDFGEFYRAVEWMGLQRHLKILGIFARLTLRDGKPRYLADTPRFIKYVRATCARYRQLGPLMVLLDEIEGNETRVGYTF
ncbi:MAG: phosphotransferase [Pseudomonadota bacterium]